MKRGMRMVVIVFISLVVLNAVLIICSSTVIYDAKRVFKGEIEPSEEIGALIRYYPRNDSRYASELKTKITIIPLFAIHNFRNGYVYVLYSEETRDKATGEIIHGSSGITSCWKIKKFMGKWRVVDITESP